MQPGVERAGTSWGHRATGLDGWAGPVGLGFWHSLEEMELYPRVLRFIPAQECPCSDMVVGGGGIGSEGCVVDNPD